MYETRPSYDYPVKVLGAQRALDADARRLKNAANCRGIDDPQARLVEKCRLVSEACGVDPATDERFYTPEDVLGWHARAVAMEAEPTAIGRRVVERLAHLELIPNARLRERYLEQRADGEVTPTRLARRLGITKTRSDRGEPKRVPDASAVERMLGVVPFVEDGMKRVRLFVTYEQAVALADALGVPYTDLGV